MKLAWQNILHDRVRFVVTVFGIAFAVLLMVFQGSLLFGFLRAASKLVDSTDSDIWITAKGVVCFDFPATLSKRFAEIAKGVPGIEQTSRIVTAFAEYKKPGGAHQPVALVGADPTAGRGFPVPQVGGAAEPDTLFVDESNREVLSLDALPLETEINRRRARVVGTVSGFSSFLGCPYVFASYNDASRYLGVGPEEAMYLLFRLAPGMSAHTVKRELQARLPEVDVWTREEFAQRSRLYWIAQTGAGGGILTAAVLGFLIGLVVVSQTIYSSTMEKLEEFATLKALGASRAYVVRVVLAQALICGIVGCCLGLAVTYPLVHAARSIIAWIYVPWWLPAATVAPGLGMCCLASMVSIRAALTVEPARVFRA
jgi:putative ABC transport system permease protein